MQPSNFEVLAQSAVALVSTSSGCRFIQALIDAAGTNGHTAVLSSLRGRIWEGSDFPHASYLLQKYIAVMPGPMISFIAHELEGRAVEAAKHRVRYRIVERLVEHFPKSLIKGLVTEILSSASTLCRHQFGNFVLQRVLEHGVPSQRHQIVQAIIADPHTFARHKCASNVVRQALVQCSTEDVQLLVYSLTSDWHKFKEMEHHVIGSFVARELKALRRSAGVNFEPRCSLELKSSPQRSQH